MTKEATAELNDFTDSEDESTVDFFRKNSKKSLKAKDQ